MDEHIKLEMPAQVREFAEKTIDQAEKGFSAFIDAANQSVSQMPSPATDLSLRALSISERNMKAAFEHARKLLHAKDVQDAMRIQAEILESSVRSGDRAAERIGQWHAFVC